MQSTWGWKIAAYLFGAGMGAGAYAFGALGALNQTLAGRDLSIATMWLGAIVVVGSALFLLWDLDRPERFIKVLFKVKRSWLARGAWILIIFGAIALVTLLAGAPPALAALSFVAALCVAVYTGLLIGTMLARPLWNSPVLPVLFLVSALSTGLALMVLGGLIFFGSNAALAKDLTRVASSLRTTHMWLLVAEALILYFYLNIAYGRSREPVLMLVKDRLSSGFWGGVVLIGLVLPFILEYLAGGAGANALGLELAAHVGVLIGGYMLRRLILAAGTRSVVQLGGPFIIRPEV